MQWKSIGLGALGAVMVGVARPGPVWWLLAFVVGLLALVVVQARLWPERVERIQARLQVLRLRSLLTGVLAVTVVGAGIAALPGPWRALWVVAALLAALSAGLRGMPAAVAAYLGARVLPAADPLRQLLVGAGLWLATLLVPGPGWLLALGLLLTGLGADLLAARS